MLSKKLINVLAFLLYIGVLYGQQPVKVYDAFYDPKKVENEGSVGSEYYVFNNKVYYTLEQGSKKMIYQSDGTANGTIVFRSFDKVWTQYSLENDILYPIKNNKFCYVVDYGDYHPKELFVSDGTDQGTFLLKTFKKINYISSDSGIIYFSGSTNTYSNYLWKSDGTVEGTTIVKKFNNQDYQYQSDFKRVGNTIFFKAYGELWKTEGDSTTTVLVKDILPNDSEDGDPDVLTAVGNKLFFVAYNNSNYSDRELWVSDGTTANTNMVKDIAPGNLSSVNHYNCKFIPFNNKLIFEADDNTHGKELWISDGTNAGTYMLKDITTDGSTNIHSYYIFNNKLYFTFFDNNSRLSLWETNGTTDGTINTGIYVSGNSSYGTNAFTVLNNELWFVADNNAKNYLCKYNGTDTTNIYLFNSNDYTSFSAKVFNNKIIFANSPDLSGGEPWISDGTKTGTHIIKDVILKPAESPFTEADNLPENLFDFDHKLYLTSSNNTLWTCHAPQAYVHKFTYLPMFDQTYIPRDSSIFYTGYNQYTGKNDFLSLNHSADTISAFDTIHNRFRYKVGNKVYFWSRNYNRYNQLWVTDGTKEETKLVEKISSDSTNFYALDEQMIYGTNTDYYFFYRSSDSVRLYKVSNSDLKTTHLFSHDKNYFYPYKLKYEYVDDKFFFSMGGLLYCSNGTKAGTKLIHQSGYEDELFLLPINNKILFSHANISSYNGFELWETDGTVAETKLVKTISYNNRILKSDAFSINNIGYFVATDEIHGIEIWKTDGTTDGTTLLKDINTGYKNSNPTNFTVVGNSFYFTATDSLHGTELWVSNGTEDSTLLVADLSPGINSTYFCQFKTVDDVLFFTKFNSAGATELWRIGTLPESEFKYTDTVASIKQVSGSKSNILVYPNPVDNYLTIINTTNTNYSYELLTINGQVIENNNVYTSETSLNTSEIKAGLYVLKIISGSEIKFVKIIKK